MSDKDESKAAGGKARARALTPERKKEIAAKAAAARWGEKPLQATHRGNFEKDFGFDVDCYVLNDAGKTAVISQRGMGSALGLTSSGQAFIRFAAGKTIAPYLGVELQEKIANPIKFQWVPRGAEKQPAGEVNGYDVTLLIDVCKAIVRAESEKRLQPSQANIARQAHIVLGASAKAGIKGLVYALSGYDATREEVITAFKLFVREEAREYEREFPPQLYEEWYRLYKLPKPERNKPWKFRHLTIEHVYKPLANSSGKVLDLTRQQRDDSGEKNKKLHQFLSEVGVKALRTQLGQLLGIARVSKSEDEYESFVKRLFGTQPDLFD
ncbi:P63C domain-containing protein [Stenotrophomonas sp.]|uniref:P63C domain-containing protein n=1 Tax=Stenotrophomonas sp. TaxID=69392 RepID=UPI0028AAB8C5|nr:P63C domain-containing protein [Stenotrophomonas sp.]